MTISINNLSLDQNQDQEAMLAVAGGRWHRLFRATRIRVIRKPRISKRCALAMRLAWNFAGHGFGTQRLYGRYARFGIRR